MTDRELKDWIRETYGVEGDCPWEDDDSTVFRHPEDRKWFALLMHILPERLVPKAYPPAEQARLRAALPRAARVDVLNVKIDPMLLGDFLAKPGMFPAYHMNKANWISILITAAEETDLKLLLDMSYEATKKKTL